MVVEPEVNLHIKVTRKAALVIHSSIHNPEEEIRSKVSTAHLL